MMSDSKLVELVKDAKAKHQFDTKTEKALHLSRRFQQSPKQPFTRPTTMSLDGFVPSPIFRSL